jgi:alkanesulfonate monooxygenase SsuD/methylene tetrahydromethanopterin reductase-like flavin-dependent oxidoreductase (luciferase family)
MKFGLFYEIPVARPWGPRSELEAYQHTLEQAILGDEVGFHSVWSVEHHFLEEYSHCSNPEVLYGAIAARTRNIRIGYGVRLLPRPYNHPIRTAESVAVLDLLSNGRVEFGTGRSSTRTELEGFGVDPHATRAMWSEALRHIVGAWTEDLYQADGEHWRMGAPRRVLPRPLQKPHPPLWGATSSPDGHFEIGRHGLGLCSFTVGVPPEDLAPRLQLYRDGLAACAAPVGKVKNEQAATFTMVHCAPTDAEAFAEAEESFPWYVQTAVRQIAGLTDWMTNLGSYQYAEQLKSVVDGGGLDHMNFDFLKDSGSAVVGSPARCIEIAKRYEAAGCDLLLCLVNPYKIPHDKVMRSIRLLGEQVLPAFR